MLEWVRVNAPQIDGVALENSTPFFSNNSNIYSFRYSYSYTDVKLYICIAIHIYSYTYIQIYSYRYSYSYISGFIFVLGKPLENFFGCFIVVLRLWILRRVRGEFPEISSFLKCLVSIGKDNSHFRLGIPGKSPEIPFPGNNGDPAEMWKPEIWS